MPDLEYLQQQAKALLDSTYSRLKDLGQSNVWNAASVMIEDSLRTRPIDDGHFVVRYVSIEPTDHLKAISKYEKTLKKRYGGQITESGSITAFLLGESMIEVMPKVDLRCKASFAESLGIIHDCMSKAGEFYADPIIVGGLSQEPRYKKSFLRYGFKPKSEKAESGYVILAESQDGINFDYPTIHKYAAPTMLFDLFSESDFYSLALEKIHSKFESVTKK